MFGLLGKIFGSEKAIGKVVDTASSLFDKLHYSEEEKAEIRLKLGNLVIDWIDKSKGMNLARRIIALGTLTVWLGNYIMAGLCGFLAILLTGRHPATKELIAANTRQVEMLEKQAELFSSNASGLGGEVMLIFGFYFAAPHLGQFISPAVDMMKARFSKTK